jgi:hypothetical protein
LWPQQSQKILRTHFKLDLVTAIGDFAFGDCSGLVDLRLPDTLTAIGDYAFGDCSGLVYLRLPDTLTEIGGHAFLVGMATRWPTKWCNLPFQARRLRDADVRLSEPTQSAHSTMGCVAPLFSVAGARKSETTG